MSIPYLAIKALGNVFEVMMKKGQDQIPDDGFLMVETGIGFIWKGIK
jgi:hypothetical protein